MTGPMRWSRDAAKAACAHRPLISLAVWRVACAEPLVALTFDDGPTLMTPRVLDTLRARGALATFFVVGRNAVNHPEIVLSALADGHELGNHSHTHQRGNLVRQADACDEALRSIGAPTRLFRPPRGEISPWPLLRLFLRGYRTIFWSLDARDSMRADGKSPDVLPDYDRVAPGDIVLMHDDNQKCIDELPQLLDLLARRSLRPVTVSSLLACRRRGLK